MLGGGRGPGRRGAAGHASMRTVKVIYRITYPNGKIYAGSDLTDTLTYFGTVDSRRIARDFTREQWRDLTIPKEIRWESEAATHAEVRRREVEFVRELRASDSAAGYNRLPKHWE